MTLIHSQKVKALVIKAKGLKENIRNLSFYLLGTILTSLIGIMINPMLAANLSPEDYAVLGYFLAFKMLVFPVISFSFISYYSRNYFRIKEEERQEVLDTLLISQVVLGFGMLLIVIVAFYIYMKLANISFPFYPFIVLSFVPALFNCFYNFLKVEKRMQKQAKSYIKIVLVNALLMASFAILFVVILKKGALGRFWGLLIPMVGMGIYSFTKLISKFQINKRVVKEAIKFGWPISFSAILYYFLTGIDRAMLEKLNDTTTFGIYNVAVQITAYLSSFSTAVSQTFEPDIYKAIADNKRKKLLALVTGIVFVNAAMALIFIVLARPLVSVLTFGRYVDSTVFAQILAIRYVPMATCFLISNVIIGYGYPKVELINRTIGAVLSIVMFRLLIERFGFYGAAWGQSLAFVLMTIVSLSFIIYKVYAPGRIRGR